MDFTLQHHGSICLLHPLTVEAQAWLDENVITDETQFWAAAIVVEPRYVDSLVYGIRDGGLGVLHG